MKQPLTPLFRTESGVLYAQDAEGRIYRDGLPQFSGPLIACDAPQAADGKLAVGCRAFLLIDDGTEFGWRITTAIVELFTQPAVPKLPSGWRWDGRELLPELIRSQRERPADDPPDDANEHDAEGQK